MLDHVFTDAIGALRDTFEKALLERQAFEERFQVDVLLGDTTWETSYGLPGEGLSAEHRAYLTSGGVRLAPAPLHAVSAAARKRSMMRKCRAVQSPAQAA